jgi:hypothetical protein
MDLGDDLGGYTFAGADVTQFVRRWLDRDSLKGAWPETRSPRFSNTLPKIRFQPTATSTARRHVVPSDVSSGQLLLLP